MRRIADRINLASELYGLVSITAVDVESAIASLKLDGYSPEYLADREELIARRIMRINPNKLAR